jgi:fimbrial chaperone protein
MARDARHRMRGRMISSWLSPLRSLALCALAAVPFGAEAGAFQVSPVRIDLGGLALTAAVTVRNDGAEPVVIQSTIVAWSQANGQDAYAPTNDALATPPLATIPPGGEQIVRVGMRRPPDRHAELAYRLYVQEVPATTRPLQTSLQVALRVGIPVFVAPAEPASRKLDWSAVMASDGELQLKVNNRGNTHLQVAAMTVVAPDSRREFARQHGLAYVLAGQAREWVMKLAGIDPQLQSVTLHLTSDAGESDETVPLVR